MHIAIYNPETKVIERAEEYDETREAPLLKKARTVDGEKIPAVYGESGAQELERNYNRLAWECVLRNGVSRDEATGTVKPSGPWQVYAGPGPFAFPEEESK